MAKCELCGGTGMKKSCHYLRKGSSRFLVKVLVSCTMYDGEDCGCNCPMVKCSCQSCFISNACVMALNKPDDCNELNKLRNYRDTFLCENYPHEIETYYKVAPVIVENINKLENYKEIYKKIWLESITPCLDLIDTKNFLKAYIKYKNLTNELYSKYVLSNSNEVNFSAPNNGKCPNCKDGYLSFDHYGPRGEEYYSCVKCGFKVKK